MQTLAERFVQHDHKIAARACAGLAERLVAIEKLNLTGSGCGSANDRASVRLHPQNGERRKRACSGGGCRFVALACFGIHGGNFLFCGFTCRRAVTRLNGGGRLIDPVVIIEICCYSGSQADGAKNVW